MPGMGGPEMARQLLEDSPSLPVLFISGYADDAELHRGALGGAAFLAKPFAPALLTDKVAELLGGDDSARSRASGGARSPDSARP